MLRQATQLDARGKLMGSPMVSTADARRRLRDAVEVRVPTPISVRGQPRATRQAAATTANPAIAWDPSASPINLIISVLASDVRLALRALRDYCQGMGIPQPASIQPRVCLAVCANHTQQC